MSGFSLAHVSVVGEAPFLQSWAASLCPRPRLLRSRWRADVTQIYFRGFQSATPNYVTQMWQIDKNLLLLCMSFYMKNITLHPLIWDLQSEGNFCDAGTKVRCVASFLTHLIFLQHMWAHAGRVEDESLVLSTALTTRPHGRSRRWCLTAVWDCVRRLSVSVPRSLKISRFANMLAWISFLCASVSARVRVSWLWGFIVCSLCARIYMKLCLWMLLPRKRNPEQTQI